jgi:hypothetical protein
MRLASDLASGGDRAVVTSDPFQTPTTAARFGSRLAVVNAKFDTGIPPTADQSEVVLVRG